MKRKSLTLAAAVAAIALAGTAAAQNIGPSTTTEPYVLPTRPGVATTSILTTGDSVGGYRMVGIPDGAGAWNENHRAFNFVVNHELGQTVGVTRAHGSKGAFVSRWQIERGTLKVLNGRDHLTAPNDVYTWSSIGYTPGTTAFERLCSADLPRQSAFSRGSLGTSRRIFLSGEETSPPFTGDHGRVFAHILTGPDRNQSWELPRLGKMAFENAVASPYRQEKTIVMLNDDASRETKVTSNICNAAGQTGCNEPPSELYVYIGTKQRHGNDIERAGLTNGNFYGVRVVVQRRGGHRRGQGLRARLVGAGHVRPLRAAQLRRRVEYDRRADPGCRGREPGHPVHSGRGRRLGSAPQQEERLLLRDHRAHHDIARHLAPFAPVAPAFR